MTPLRRTDRSVSRQASEEILSRAEYGILSTVSPDGRPYGIPLNFCRIGDCLYFHCALEGKKIRHLQNNQSVSFCAVGQTAVLADKFATLYESVVVSGEAQEVFGGEKRTGLEGLIRKYSNSFFEEGIAYIEAHQHKTRVFRIAISEICGKARRE